MNLFKKLAWDSLWLLIARIGAQGLMVIVTYFLARRLGAAGFGEYAFIATIVTVGNVLTTFGSDMVLIREIAAKGDFSDMPLVLILQLILSSLFIGFVFLFAPSLPNQTMGSVLALKVYSFALIPLAFFTVFTSVLRGVQRMTLYAWLNLGVAVFQVVAVIFFVHHGTNIVDLAYLLLEVQTAGALFAGFLCLPLIAKLKARQLSLNKLLSLFILCLPVALIAIIGILYQKMSLAMLSFLGSASMVGLYSAAARIVEVARIGSFAVFTALYPVMANAGQNKISHTIFKFSWVLLLLFSIVGSVLIFLLAKPIVYILFGMDYLASVVVLKILTFTLIPYTANSFLSLMLLARNQEKLVLRVLGASLVLLLILNFWLILRAGYIGAGWAVFIAECTQAILFLWVWRSNPFRPIDVVSSKGVSYEFSNIS